MTFQEWNDELSEFEQIVVTCYAVYGEDCTDEQIVIPRTHLGRAVVAIGEFAFAGSAARSPERG